MVGTIWGWPAAIDVETCSVTAARDMLDSIETQVAKTVEYVQAGTVALTEAKTLQKRGRKMMCCVIVILLVIIMTVVVGVTKPWQDGKA